MNEITGTRLMNPSFLHGWNFLSVISSDEDDALPIQAVACQSGPAIVVNTMHISTNDLEIPFVAMTWLPLAIQSITSLALTEAHGSEDYIGDHNSENWELFRAEVEKHSGLDWEDVVDMIDVEGMDFVVDYTVSNLFIESGIHTVLKSRMRGMSALQLTA